MSKLTHFDEKGKARMVDISGKSETERYAIATGKVLMKPETLSLITEDRIKKGDVVTVAKVAGIMAAKRVEGLIPMCHKILLTNVNIDIEMDSKENSLKIVCTARSTGKTGVEMEALTGVAIAALTIYDMCKAVDREMVISEIMLLEKRGGKSGHFVREAEKGDERKIEE